jgi:glyoxylase-like metal-dependent hydrolase (beta-lactamase superfamily II)
MLKQIYVSPDIFHIAVPLPNLSLGKLNCYVIKSGDETLIIDSGLKDPICLEAMESGLREITVNLNKTSMFLTHYHADHCGLAAEYTKRGVTAFMGKTEYREYQKSVLRSDTADIESYYKGLGAPDWLIDSFITIKRPLYGDEVLMVTELVEGDHFQIGNDSFTVIETPGHSPGHMCLYSEKHKILFSGDHILFDVSPNITATENRDNILKKYLNSLKRTAGLSVQNCFPGHGRYGALDVHKRANELLQHHHIRLGQIFEQVKYHSGRNCQELSKCIPWALECDNWDNLPAIQYFFILSETKAHLDYLLEYGLITVKDNRYYPG